MLQRIQTIYMLASVIAVLMMFLFPLATFQIPEATLELSAFGLTSVTEAVELDEMCWPLLILLLVMIVLPFMTIFLYNKRKMQLRLLIYTAVLDILFFAFYFLYELPACKALVLGMSAGQEISVATAMILFFMPTISFVACIMAMRGVLYDIALLSSADRLRPSRK